MRTNGRSPLDYLARRQAGDGHYRYSSSSDQTPVWVTGQALMAVSRKAFPLTAVPRTPTDAGSGRGPRGGAPGGGSEPGPAGGTATGDRSEAGPGSEEPSDPPRSGSTVRGALASGEGATAPAAPAAAAANDDGGLGTSAYVGAGFGLLTAALAGGFLWYRRRLP